jgi:hypothetical protein
LRVSQGGRGRRPAKYMLYFGLELPQSRLQAAADRVLCRRTPRPCLESFWHGRMNDG